MDKEDVRAMSGVDASLTRLLVNGARWTALPNLGASLAADPATLSGHVAWVAGMGVAAGSLHREEGECRSWSPMRGDGERTGGDG